MSGGLAMGGDLHTKTGAGHLFMGCGRPELRGVDVYDPITGQVRSGSTVMQVYAIADA